MKKLVAMLGFVASVAWAVGCQATEAPKFEEGKHYVVLPHAVRTSDPSRIEVTEVFRYSCHVCYEFSGQVRKWAETLPADVAFVRNPTSAGYPQFRIHVPTYYAAQSLGLVDKLHHKLFSAYHDQNKLKNQREIGDVFLEAGIERDEFDKVFNSWGVNSQSKQAESRAKGYRITATPCLVVNGKYRIGSGAGSREAMLEVANFLIEKERQARK